MNLSDVRLVFLLPFGFPVLAFVIGTRLTNRWLGGHDALLARG